MGGPGRRLLAELTCAGKVSHPSRKLALDAMRVQVRGLDLDGRDREPMCVYRCEFCKGFHVGRSQVRKSKRWREGRGRAQGDE